MATTLENTLNYADLKTAYIDLVNGGKVCKRAGNQSKAAELATSWQRKTSFYGPNSKSVIEWLHKGYRAPGLTLDPPIDPIRKRRRLKYGDEGELQLDLMWSGHDYPWLDWTKRDLMPGMRVDIMYNFVCTTSVQVIIDYCQFVLRSLIALESAGIDLEVWISSDNTDVFMNGDRNDKLYNHVQVKKEGEQTDYLGWSAMVSPGGFRHLMFLDYILAADALGRDISRGLGRGTNHGQPWDVTFEPGERFLRFYCPWSPWSFDEKEMEMKLREVIRMSKTAAA
jgi:hypothetical protein